MNHGLSAAAVAEIHKVLGRFQEVEKAVLYGHTPKGIYDEFGCGPDAAFSRA